MPQTKEEWFSLILIVIISVTAIGSSVGYTVNGVDTHSPLLVFKLATFSVDGTPLIVSLFFTFLISMAGFISFQILSQVSTAGAIAIGASLLALLTASLLGV